MQNDGTLDATIYESRFTAQEAQLTVLLPAGLDQTLAAGRYFLVRCGAQSWSERLTCWDIYARRPLYVGAVVRESDEWDRWTLVALQSRQDPGVAWLAERAADETINLIGPLGQGFPPPASGQNLLLVTDAARLPLLSSLIQAALDRGGRITLVLADFDSSIALLPLQQQLPLAVEVHRAESRAALLEQLGAMLLWADRLDVALPTMTAASLAQAIRGTRLRVEAGFAHLLCEADLVCGSGACLACVVPTAGGGLTRACVHGPVLDLTRLT